MRRSFTLETWKDGDWFVGRLLEVPGVFSQGATEGELREKRVRRDGDARAYSSTYGIDAPTGGVGSLKRQRLIREWKQPVASSCATVGDTTFTATPRTDSKPRCRATEKYPIRFAN